MQIMQLFLNSPLRLDVINSKLFLKLNNLLISVLMKTCTCKIQTQNEMKSSFRISIYIENNTLPCKYV